VTGIKGSYSDEQISYFKRVKAMDFKNPGLIGFGISDRDTFAKTCEYAAGGIIGSAFVNILGQDGNVNDNIRKFVKGIRA
jgi:tryptophan synthase alpha chain